MLKGKFSCETLMHIYYSTLSSIKYPQFLDLGKVSYTVFTLFNDALEINEALKLTPQGTLYYFIIDALKLTPQR